MHDMSLCQALIAEIGSLAHEHLDRHGVHGINLISLPGVVKTALLD